MSDKLLLKVIKPIVNLLKKKNYISKWFFIRYNDPDFHIRIRLFITDCSLTGDIINIFHTELKKWSSSHFLHKVQIDTYIREIERYENNLIEETEHLFYMDSECILSLLPQLNKNKNYRWMIAIKLIDSLLMDFKLDLCQKQIIIEQMNHNFKKEFGFNLYNSKQFNSIYRINRKTIESILETYSNDSEFHSLYRHINRRTIKSRNLISTIKNKINNSKSIKLNNLLNSYIHMSMNRLFPDKARMHELIIYDMINRFYSSALAKEKYNNKT